MLVVLSGGDLGGQEVEWPEGQETIVIYGLVYRLTSQTQAVFVGVE